MVKIRQLETRFPAIVLLAHAVTVAVTRLTAI
jgi:hypothetical protein